jgi:hypothetical protein
MPPGGIYSNAGSRSGGYELKRTVSGMFYSQMPSIRENTVLWIVTAGLLAFCACGLLDRHLLGHTSPLFWDVPVYLRAADLLASGQNPYDSALLHQSGVPSYLYFISPPAVMLLLAAVAKSPFHALLAPTLYVLHFVAMIATPLLLGRLLFGGSPARLGLALGAFFTLFAAAGLGAFSAMNNGSVLNLLIVATAVHGLTRGRWTGFHIAALIAAIFKPYYVFFWILPVLAKGFDWRHVFIGAALTLLAALTYILPIWLAPDIFHAWMGNVLTTLAVGGVGANVFGALDDWITAAELGWLPHAAQLVYIGYLAGLLLLTRLRGRELWAALLLSAVFMNPRPLGYDVAIAAIPLAYLTARLLPHSLGWSLRLALSTTGLAVSMMVISYNDHIAPAAMLFPLAAGGVLTLTALRARHRSAAREAGAPSLAARKSGPGDGALPQWTAHAH